VLCGRASFFLNAINLSLYITFYLHQKYIQLRSEAKGRTKESPPAHPSQSLQSLAFRTIPNNLTASLCGLSESRADGTELDVGVDDSGARGSGLNVLGLARVDGAGTTGDTRLLRVSVCGVGGVEPEHVDRMVVPEGHDQDVAASKRSTHLVKTTNGGEGRSVTEDALLLGAEVFGDGVTSNALDSRVGVLKDSAALDVEALDLREAGARADELGDNGHLLGAVQSHARAVEVTDTHAVAVEIATVLVAKTTVAVVTVTAAYVVGALLETSALAGMGSVGGGDGVGLPDVHLWAASTDLTLASVRVVGRRVPALNVSLSVDELDIVRTLGVAVSGSVLGTGLVVTLVDTTVGGHLDEVESTVQTARQLGGIDVEGELLADEVEHLVLGVALHEVGTRTDVAAGGTLGNELEGQSIAASGDTVSA
jgi:hypothetical protein